MNNNELREGVARTICHTDVSAYCLWEAEDELIWGDGESFSTVEEAVEKHWRSYTPHADAALAYIRQHFAVAAELITESNCEKAQWQPISTAPKDGTLILGDFSDGETSWHFSRCVVRWSGSDLSLWSSKGVSGLLPTRWMAIPEPPKESNE